MLARFGGGNSGIVEYLENGRKQGRDLTRDELDNRVILDGDLRLTENVINSIPDSGQERYLHVTLSFFESEVSEDTLKQVAEEYKELLMSAYHSDEFCFYAEAHLPKVKNIIDNRTGELVERKPHIHIVIPRTNLVTGKSLNPRGDMTKGATIEQIDAIQEHINNKYGLVSPKDGVRVSDHNHANVLARTKGDLFKEKQGELKKEIFDKLEKSSIKTDSEFTKMLKDFGEVKVYNKGKENQYFGVKPEGQERFTRLKSPVFSKQFIENRAIPLIKPSVKQIENRLEEWTNKTSLEIKHIYPSGEKIRNDYKKLPADQKFDVLKEVKAAYDKKHGLETGVSRAIQRRISQRSVADFARGRPASHDSERLSHLQARKVVNSVQGMGVKRDGQFGEHYTNELNALLRNVQRDNLAEKRQNEQYDSGTVRWSQSDRGRTRVKNTIADELKRSTPIDNNELALMREVMSKIDPDRFLSFVAAKYNVDPYAHKVSIAKDGSPRFKVDKRNLNASDFLTKFINLSWDESKADLLEVWDNQMLGVPYQKVYPYRALTKEQADERFHSLRGVKDSVRATLRELQSDVYVQKKNELKQLYKIKDPVEREVERGFIVFKELIAKEKIQQIRVDANSAINAIHNHWQPERDNEMELKKTLSGILNQNLQDNTISNADTNISIKKRMEINEQFEEHKAKTLKELIAHKVDDKQVKYLDKNTKETVFTDKGNHLSLSGKPTEDRIALALEYAQAKYGGVLHLTGTDSFKEACAITAAERGMNVIFKPDVYHDMMLERLKALDAEKSRTNENQIKPDPVEPSPIDNVMAKAKAPDPVQEQEAKAEFSAELDAQNAEKIKEVVKSYTPENTVENGYQFDLDSEISPKQVFDYLQNKAESQPLVTTESDTYLVKNDHLYVEIDAIEIINNNNRYDVTCKSLNNDVIKFKDISDTQTRQLLAGNPQYQNDFDANKSSAVTTITDMKQVSGVALSPINTIKTEIENLTELKSNLKIDASKEQIESVIQLKNSELEKVTKNTFNSIELKNDNSFKFDGAVVDKALIIKRDNGNYDLTLSNTKEPDIKNGTIEDHVVVKLDNVDKRYIESALGENYKNIVDAKEQVITSLEKGNGSKFEPYIVDGHKDIASATVERNLDDTFDIKFEDVDNKIVYELKALTPTDFERALGSAASGLKDMRKAEPVKVERLIKGNVQTPVGAAVQHLEQTKVSSNNNKELVKQAEHDLNKVLSKHVPNYKPKADALKERDSGVDFDR